MSGTWDEQSSSWNNYGAPTNVPRIVAASPDNEKLYVLEYGETADGAEFTSYIERVGLALSDTPEDELPYRKLCTRMWAVGVGQVTVTFGAYAVGSAATTWKAGVAFDFAVDNHLPVEVAGRFLSVRIGTIGSQAWSWDSCSFDVSVIGQF